MSGPMKAGRALRHKQLAPRRQLKNVRRYLRLVRKNKRTGLTPRDVNAYRRLRRWLASENIRYWGGEELV